MTIKPTNNLKPKSLRFQDLKANQFYEITSIDYQGAIVLTLEPDYRTQEFSSLILLVVEHSNEKCRKIIGKPYAIDLVFKQINVNTPFDITIG